MLLLITTLSDQATINSKKIVLYNYRAEGAFETGHRTVVDSRLSTDIYIYIYLDDKVTDGV